MKGLWNIKHANKWMWMDVLLFKMHDAFIVSPARAQCGIENTAFKSGEFLGYDLYFN